MIMSKEKSIFSVVVTLQVILVYFLRFFFNLLFFMSRLEPCLVFPRPGSISESPGSPESPEAPGSPGSLEFPESPEFAGEIDLKSIPAEAPGLATNSLSQIYMETT